MKKTSRKSLTPAQQRKRKGLKAGIIAFGVTALLYSLLFPLYRIGDFILCALVSAVVGKVISIMGEGLDLTTHNKQDKKNEPEPVAEIPLSGNDNADEVILKGQEMLHTIRAENDAITDEALSGQMDELERLCVQIFTTVAEKPQKAPQIRKFMNYYLPTTLKMLASYRTMNERGVSADDMTNARAETIRGMNMVLTACQKQLDNLYKDTMLDVSTDIDVLEQMLKRDGYADSNLTGKSATAAAQQMNSAGSPMLNVPKTSAGDDDFVSFYSQDRKN